MSRNMGNWKKIQRNIYYDESSETYYVNGGTLSITAFPTLNDAIEYRDVFLESRKKIKMERAKSITHEREKKELAKLAKAQYPYDALEAMGMLGYSEYYDEAFNKLRDKEKDCVLKVFRDGTPLQEVSKSYKVTKERIRQLVAKALANMKESIHVAVRQDKTQALAKSLEEDSKALEKWRAKIFEEYKKTHEYGDDMVAAFGSPTIVPQKSTFHDQRIEDVGLSIRSYNCLKRYGIKTIGDLAGKTVAELMKVRNLGKRSLKEVLDVLRTCGIELKES